MISRIGAGNYIGKYALSCTQEILSFFPVHILLHMCKQQDLRYLSCVCELSVRFCKNVSNCVSIDNNSTDLV